MSHETLLAFATVIFITSINGGDIDCSGYRICAHQDVNCTSGSNCNIYCGQQGCFKSHINCPNYYDCNVYLTNYESAFNSIINGNKASKLLITTPYNTNTGSQLEQSTIHCPYNGTCNIQCNDYHSCRLTQIKAETSNILEIECSNKNEECINLQVWCSIKGKCYINGNDDTSSMIRMNIYNVNGFNSLTIDGSPTSNSIGIIHCLHDYTSQCIVDPINNNECLLSSNNTICNHSSNKIGHIYCIVDIQYITLSICMILITTYITCKFCIHNTNNGVILQNEQTNNKNIFVLKSIAITQMISLWISYIFWIIEIMIDSYCNESNDKHKSIIYFIMNGMNEMFFIISLMAYYMYMLYRLDYTFYDNIYFKVSKKYKYFHLFIILLIPFWYMILIYYNNNIHFYLIFCGVGLSVTFIGLFILVLKFNNNLFKLLLQQKQIEISQQQILPIYLSLTYIQKKESICIEVIAKHALLTTIMICVSIMFIFFIFVLSFKSIQKTDIIWILYEWFLAFSMIINLICVYFGFNCNDKQYQKICGICHRKILTICTFLVGRSSGTKLSLNEPSVSTISSIK